MRAGVEIIVVVDGARTIKFFFEILGHIPGNEKRRAECITETSFGLKNFLEFISIYVCVRVCQLTSGKT